MCKSEATIEDVADVLTYRKSPKDTSAILVAQTPISAEAAVPKFKPVAFVGNTLVPLVITNPIEPKGTVYPVPTPAFCILTTSVAVVLADTLLLIT